MNIIIPMAGMGKRMRPHSLTTPKPLIKVAGKSIVQRLAEDISKMMNDKIENIKNEQPTMASIINAILHHF